MTVFNFSGREQPVVCHSNVFEIFLVVHAMYCMHIYADLRRGADMFPPVQWFLIPMHAVFGAMAKIIDWSRHFYRLRWSWGKVIFSEACVKNSVHRGSAPFHAGITPPPPEQTPEADTTLRQTPPPAKCMLGETANNLAVRFLLECILVSVVPNLRNLEYGTDVFSWASTLLQIVAVPSSLTDAKKIGEAEVITKHRGQRI